ncbi:hypothetical protein F4821DRAFT_250938 [Hypoxylon rubiginosum]|uniref:Uncharacterized protein n=1 Tax=Hypoxylon rubiginosum TaxID=110542 RepID=A0ACC0CK16_9PEZI|nr:hypothetical protein F4821DRAFT_250938 [Hypoxylon rubiginosum]
MAPILHHDFQTQGQKDSSDHHCLSATTIQHFEDHTSLQDAAPAAISISSTQHSYHIFRAWVWEIFSILSAIALIAAIASLLFSFDGSLPPDWGANINLNAVLALLSTVFRAMLVIVVSQIISQRKWDWYRDDHLRSLADLQKFDTGSRGVLGALSLVPKVLLRDFIALIAAIILLLSFLVGPFVQQASRTVSCAYQAPGMAASLPYAHFVPRTGGYTNKDGPPKPTTDTRITLLSSATAAEGVENQISGTCSTGNCTFPNGDPIDAKVANDLRFRNDETSHSTVALCNKCTDVRSLVSVSTAGSSQTYSLPNGFNISDGYNEMKTVFISPNPELDWMGNTFNQELQTISRWAFSNVTFLTLTPGVCTSGYAMSCPGSYQAAVCILYPCLQSYVASITNGELSEEIIQSEPMQLDLMPNVDDPPSNIESTFENLQGQSAFDVYVPYAAVKSPCQVDGAIYDLQNMSSHPATTNLSLFVTEAGSNWIRNLSAPEACIYRHDYQFSRAVISVLEEDLFSGTCYVYRSFTCEPTTQTIWGGLGTIKVLETLYNNGSANFSYTENLFESFAKATSNRYRFQFGSSTSPSAIGNVAPVNLLVGEIQGIAWQTSACVLVQGQWLLLPAGLALAAAILSVWTIATSWRYRHSRPVWKDSILPLILYSDRLEPKNLPPLTHHLDRDDLIKDGTCLEEQEMLLEATEMGKVADRTPVKFRWPHNADQGSLNKTGPVTLTSQEDKWWTRRRKTRQFDTDSLLDEREGLNE